MTNICENCKYKSEAVQFSSSFKIIGRYCKAMKTWIPAEINGCDYYESNLHDHNAAP